MKPKTILLPERSPIMMLRPCLRAHATQARPPAHKGQWMDGGAEACGSVVRPTLTGSTLQHSPQHRAAAVPARADAAAARADVSLCSPSPALRPPLHAPAGYASYCSRPIRADTPAHPAHKIFHRLRATAPAPAAVLLLRSGRARRPCAASLAPAGGGDGEAEEPWKSMETTRRIIKQSAVDVLGELVFRRVISSHLTTTCVGSVVVDKKKKKKKILRTEPDRCPNASCWANKKVAYIQNPF